MSKKVLITGSGGFIGSHLSEYFLNQGCTVFGIDNFKSSDERNTKYLLGKYSSSFRFICEDILNKNACFEFLRGHDIEQMFHLACPASPPIYQKDPLNTLDVCYLGTRNILDLAVEKKSRILLASTSETYGDPLVHPQPESYRGNVNTTGIRSCYDEGKRVLETLGFIYRQSGLCVRTARIFNTYGPRMLPEDGRVLTNFITQALAGKPLTVYGTGEQTRSLCFYKDLILGLTKLIDSNYTEPVNLGSQFEFKIIDVARLVISKIDKNLDIVHMPLPLDDPKLRRPDITLAKNVLKWEPLTPLSDGLDHMIEYYREMLL